MRLRTQKELSNDDKRNLRWSSHIPINTAILKTFPITGVMELGAGFNSTKLFNDSGVPYLSVEQDADWIKQLNLPNVIHYQCPDKVTRSTLRHQLSNEELVKFTNFCHNHVEIWSNFLFVDSFAGYRLQALNDLYQRFDVVIWHDFEESEDKNYGYSEFKPNNNYLMFRDATWLANCGLLFKKELIQYFPQFMSEFERQCKLFAEKHKVQHEVRMIKL